MTRSTPHYVTRLLAFRKAVYYLLFWLPYLFILILIIFLVSTTYTQTMHIYTSGFAFKISRGDNDHI